MRQQHSGLKLNTNVFNVEFNSLQIYGKKNEFELPMV